jgi:hypothetical protein
MLNKLQYLYRYLNIEERKHAKCNIKLRYENIHDCVRNIFIYLRKNLRKLNPNV